MSRRVLPFAYVVASPTTTRVTAKQVIAQAQVVGISILSADRKLAADDVRVRCAN